MEEKQDRLSDLPDSVLHHILSFLPSIKEAIRTGVLSKRWRNQWTFVPNLIFDFSAMNTDYPPEIIPTMFRIIDHTLALHECSKIQKFHIISEYYINYYIKQDHYYEETLHSIIRKQVEELILKFNFGKKFRLPNFFFRQAFLVKLEFFRCSIMHTVMVNFESLKDLFIYDCDCCVEVIRRIVLGSPVLRSLEIQDCDKLRRLVIASKSLKRLVLQRVILDNIDFDEDISCPNLVEIHVEAPPMMPVLGFPWCDIVLGNFLSESPLLESIVLKWFQLRNLRIDSKILRKLVLEKVKSHEIEISCPRLEELGLSGSIETIRLMDLPSSACAALNLVYREGYNENVPKQILEQLQHLNELKLGYSFIETLSDLEVGGVSYPLLNITSLTVKGRGSGPSFAHSPGILFALRSSPMLEELVVELQPHVSLRPLFYQEPKLAENYWNSNGTRFSNLVSHLRTVKIDGFSRREDKSKLVLDFVEFILKNAKVLEKVVVILKYCGTDFVIKVSQKLLSFPRCSPRAIVEVYD